MRTPLLRRIRRALLHARVERDMEEEMRLHLELEAEEGMRLGLSPVEARRRALVAFGGVDRHKEAAREARLASSLVEWKRELGQALRALVRRPGYTLVVVTTLAVAIAADTGVFAVADAVLFRPLPYPEGDRLVQLWQGTPAGREWVSGPDFLDWRERLRTVEQAGAYTPDSYNVVVDEGAENVTGAAVSAGFFEAAGVAAAEGRTPRADEDRPGAADVVVLSAGLRRRLFGEGPAVGSAVLVDGAPTVVVGVMPGTFDLPRGAELWRPLKLGAEEWQLRRGIDWLLVVARLRAGQDAAAVATDLAGVSAALARTYPETNAGERIEAVSLREQLASGVATPLHLLMGAVLLVLALACANVAGLVVARGGVRSRELAVRRALGAEPRHLRRALLAESVVLAVGAAVAGLLLGLLSAQGLIALAPARPGTPPDIGPTGRVLAFTAVVSLLSLLAFGVAPALRAARVAPAWALASGSAGAGERAGERRTRRALVVVQVALAVVLVTGAALLVRTLANLRGEDPGFQAAGVLTARIALTPAHYPDSTRLRTYYDELLGRVRALPGVEAVGLASDLPLAGTGITFSYQVEGRPPASSPQEAPLAGYRTVTAEYFEALGIRFVAGRDFQPADDHGARVAIIDETLAARDFAGRDPLGARLDVGGDARTIVGVVGAVRHATLRSPPAPTIYIPYAHRARPGMTLVVRGEGDDAMRLAGTVRAAFRAIDAAQPMFAVRPMTEYLDRDVSTQRFLAVILAAFAATALLLALIGVYGIVAFAVARRRREIGIRVALGSAPGRVVRSVALDGVVLTAVGLVAGLAASVALARLIESLLYDVRGFDPPTLGWVAALVTLAALAASWLPARRAAALDPAETLRGD
jgi:putative ABC transport system permease protein